MGTGIFRTVRTALAGLFLLLWAARPALAGETSGPFEAGSTCHAYASHSETLAEVSAAPARWTCEESNWSAWSEKAFIRFDMRERSGPPPSVFFTRLTRFAEMRVTVFGTNGHSATRQFRQDDVRPATADWKMSVDLPRVDSPLSAVVVEIHQPRYIGMLADAAVGTPEEANGGGPGFELFIAALCGMLCMPLLFNLTFYQVLRERFLLWHALAVGFMLVQTVVTSGLVNHFADLTVMQLSILSAASFAGGVVGALLFAADLMEEGTVDPFHRRVLRTMAVWVPCWTLFYLFSGEALRPVTATLYYLSWLPVLASMVWVMAVARTRGSRTVDYQIAAWFPFILTGLIRILSALGLTEMPLEMQVEQHLAIAFEVVVTALGVTDRFLTIKRQRDNAWAETRMLQDRIGHDPLTGLLNRHSIERRFGLLLEQGFRTVAVLDLDRFKQINDSYGHAMGDMVLRAVGSALAADDDTISIRLGGEEFMILLRGPDTADRAERRRQAIALRVSADVPGLDRLVTASMGLVEYGTRTRVQPDFATAYAHCDRLLYDAKRTGRNRTMKEKVQGFSAPATQAIASA